MLRYVLDMGIVAIDRVLGPACSGWSTAPLPRASTSPSVHFVQRAKQLSFTERHGVHGCCSIEKNGGAQT